MINSPNKPQHDGLRRTLYEIIFEAETSAGKLFDVILLWAIILSVIAVSLETVKEFDYRYHQALRIAEWIFTGLFTVEYVLRIYCSRRPLLYIFSFFGVIDLLAVVPSYLSLFITGSHQLMIIRVIRLLRVFRVLKMTRYVGEAEVLMEALRASRHRITVFVGAVLSIVVVMGTVLYLVEDPENGFTSIPKSMYWAIVTLTTVGYGDIAPQTVLGQTLAAFVMILGYGIIAVPTGIVTVELTRASERARSKKTCSKCNFNEPDSEAHYCRRCGAEFGPIE